MRNLMLGFLLATCAFATGAVTRSSLGELEGPAHEWLVGKKGWLPVAGVPQRTLMSGQWVNDADDPTIIIDWDQGKLWVQHLIVDDKDGANSGENYDLMQHGEMALIGVDVSETRPEIRDLPDTVN